MEATTLCTVFVNALIGRVYFSYTKSLNSRRMNLKRHHVLYGILAVSLMLALVVFLTPASPSVSYTQGTAATTSAPFARDAL